jgi:dihydrofolate synthase/folylpolyglutamate synthase
MSAQAGVRLLTDLMGREWSGMKLGLTRFRQLLAALEHPEARTPAILVGGTNGKGSVAAALASMLSAAGYRTGLYSSPHLLSYRERVRVDGRAIRPAAVAAAMEILGPAIEAHGSSFFEAMTALAFLHFAREKVDIAVLEVGIGGALDATNVVDPLVSVVVSVGLDHMDVLGPTITDIARDKAGIARPDRPFVIGAVGKGRTALLAAADRAGACPLLVGADGRYRVEELRADGSRFTFRGPALEAAHLELGLAGGHQVRNAACALLALGALPEFPAAAGVRPGLARFRWPGRMERVTPWLLVDGAHNAEGARVLAAHLRRFFGGRKVVAVTGMVAGKRPRAFARALCGAVHSVVVTAPPSARAIPAAALAADLQSAGLRAAVAPDIATALERARTAAGARGLVVACGSLYLVGAVLRILGRRPVESIF